MATLEITTCIGCGVDCSYCPQDKIVGAYEKGDPRIMTVEVFKRVIDKIPPHVRIDFSGMAEPFQNKNCMDMIIHASEKTNPICIYSTLIGMTPADAEALAILLERNRFTEFVIHLPDRKGAMKNIHLTDEYIRCLKVLSLTGKVRYMTMDGSGFISAELEKILQGERWGLRVLRDISRYRFKAWTRGGNLGASLEDVEELVEHLDPVCCSVTPFFDHNVLLPNGDILLCCMDYGKDVTLGNLLVDSYYDLFTSRALSELVKGNMKHYPGGTICKKCSVAKQFKCEDGSWGEKRKKPLAQVAVSKLKRLLLWRLFR